MWLQRFGNCMFYLIITSISSLIFFFRISLQKQGFLGNTSITLLERNEIRIFLAEEYGNRKATSNHMWWKRKCMIFTTKITAYCFRRGIKSMSNVIVTALCGSNGISGRLTSLSNYTKWTPRQIKRVISTYSNQIIIIQRLTFAIRIICGMRYL